MKVRILRVTTQCGDIYYQIQQLVHYPFWPFPKTWVNAWLNSSLGAACIDSFPTLELAQKNLCFFNGSAPKAEIMIGATNER